MSPSPAATRAAGDVTTIEPLRTQTLGEGGPTSIVTDGPGGRLCRADAGALAEVVVQLAAQPLQRVRLANTALQAVAQRTWERSLQRLAEGYRRALEPTDAITNVSRAA